MSRAFAFLLAAFFLASAAAQDPPKAGPPAAAGVAELTAAKRAYEADVAKATEALLGEFAHEEKRILDNAKLKIDDKIKRSELLQDEKKAFEADGKLPKTLGLKVATSDYQAKVSAARSRCEKAFDKAAETAGKSDLALAKVLLGEKAEFLKPGPTAPAPKPGDAVTPVPPGPAGPSPLVGTWERAVNATNLTIQKHVTPTHYMVFQYDGTGRVYMAHGGRYTLKGDSHAESVEYGFGPYFDKHTGTTVTTKSKLIGKKWYLSWTEGDRNIQANWEPVEPKPPANPKPGAGR